jgi:hypothetical protein
MQIGQYTEHAIKLKQAACSRRSEDHRPRPRRGHRRRCWPGRRWYHCRCLHLTCGSWSIQLRLLLILLLLHHHTRMTTGLGRGFQNLKAGSAIRDRDHRTETEAPKLNLAARAIGIGSTT